MGVCLVLSVLHGGNGLPAFAKPVYDYLVSGSYNGIVVPDLEIPNSTLQFVVQKVCIRGDCMVLLVIMTVMHHVVMHNV